MPLDIGPSENGSRSLHNIWWISWGGAAIWVMFSGDALGVHNSDQMLITLAQERPAFSTISHASCWRRGITSTSGTDWWWLHDMAPFWCSASCVRKRGRHCPPPRLCALLCSHRSGLGHFLAHLSQQRSTTAWNNHLQSRLHDATWCKHNQKYAKWVGTCGTCVNIFQPALLLVQVAHWTKGLGTWH